MQMPLVIYNTLTREKETFQSIELNKVNMYVCGITTYDLCHVGHARVMIFFDVVRRYLESVGYEVKYVRNITDIDDKIINRANEIGEAWDDLKERFIQEMHNDFQALGLIAPQREPKATEFIAEIIQMIEQLQANGFAYVADNGDVCFEVSQFSDYGNLSHQDLDKLQAGARVSIIEEKRSPLDFVLWKLAKPNEPSWSSPWGDGRPGWHIECSAMSTQCLAPHIDIHGGGLDLTFPHHENEIAQSQCATGEKFVNTWMHVGFVQVNKEKMSKSLGNFFTLRDVLKEFSGEEIRLFMLSSHYRSPINYTDEYLQQAKTSLKRFYTAFQGVDQVQWRGEVGAELEVQFHTKMRDDFNTPEALAVLYEITHHLNRAKESGEREQAQQYAALLNQLGQLLGLFNEDAATYWQRFKTMDTAMVEQIEQLIADRESARSAQDWSRADQIRAQLDALNVTLADTADGTQWRQK